ncbi:hypothetical protein Q9S36_32195 [Microbacterium sp. ARD31]|uniref:hypothetical protein n=1 Tax=Microbacterium sp. ARD31 TaxID=2962576 RepID=UPI0028816448|nr:hypothetical protein [Microbacterium sp. ARD31]MDT0184855.1 hypothetical protein [Microbacterium sp. ARD31]
MDIPRRTAGHRALTWSVPAALVVISAGHLASTVCVDLRLDPFALLSAVLGVVGILTASRLAVARCFESRLAARLIAGATLLGAALSHTLGLPGSDPLPWTGGDVVIVGLSTAVIAALAHREVTGNPREL